MTTANVQSVMYANGEAQSQSLTKKKAGEIVDAQMKSSMSIRRDPATGKMVFDLKNFDPSALPNVAKTDLQNAQDAPREDAAQGMATAQTADDLRSRIDAARQANAAKILELRGRGIDQRMSHNFNGSWSERRQAARDMGANWFTSMIDATRVGHTISRDEANRQYELMKEERKAAALDEADKSLPSESMDMRRQSQERADLTFRRNVIDSFVNDPQRTEGSDEDIVPLFTEYAKSYGLTPTGADFKILQKEIGSRRAKKDTTITTGLQSSIRQAQPAILNSYPDADQWIADLEGQAGRSLTKTEQTLARGKFKWLTDQKALADAAEERRIQSAARAASGGGSKPTKPSVDWSVDDIVASDHPAAGAIANQKFEKLQAQGQRLNRKAGLLDESLKKATLDAANGDPDAANRLERLRVDQQSLNEEVATVNDDLSRLRAAGFTGGRKNGLKSKPQRPRATNAKGESVEWDGKAWVPVK